MLDRHSGLLSDRRGCLCCVPRKDQDEFRTTEEQQQVKISVREFAEAEIAPARDGVG